MPPVLDVRRLTVRLGGREVLREVTFAVEAGTWVALVGPNGSGKTTLLRTLAGLLPYAGGVRLRGRDVRAWRPRERARRLAFARQTQPLAFEMTALEFVLLGRTPHRGWLEPFTTADRRRALEALAAMDLADAAHRPVPELSGGEQQRVRLAQVLAQDAEVLLLDEPTAHLDVHHQYDLLERVALLAHAGRTVVSALHDLPLAARYADHLLVLDRGCVAAFGPPPEVLDAHLLRTVFRMDAEVDPGPPPAVRFLAPSSPLAA